MGFIIALGHFQHLNYYYFTNIKYTTVPKYSSISYYNISLIFNFTKYEVALKIYPKSRQITKLFSVFHRFVKEM